MRGATWLTSHEENAFSEADQATMDAVADLLALAIERTGVRERENLRRDRIDSLRQLLLTMAGALDVRQVFPEVSTVIRGGLPHDMLVLTAWSESGSLVARLRGGRHQGHGPRVLGANRPERGGQGARSSAAPTW